MDKEKIRIKEESQSLVVKSNLLIRNTRYDLTVIQQKVIIYLISKIVAEDNDLNEVVLSVKDFCLLTGIEPKGNNYKQIKDSIRALKKKDWWIDIDNDTEMLYSWLDYAIIKKNSGEIRIALSQSLKPYLIQLRSHFTKYRLNEILNLNSRHAIRLFEFIQSYLFKGEYTADIDEIKRILGIENKYSDYRDLRKAVLEPSIKQINENTYLHVEYEPIKVAKKVVAIKFKVNEAVGFQTSWLDEEEVI